MIDINESVIEINDLMIEINISIVQINKSMIKINESMIEMTHAGYLFRCPCVGRHCATFLCLRCLCAQCPIS